MSKVKKIISSVISEGIEAVKDSASQIGETINPTSLLESAIGPKQKSSEFTDYLKGLGPLTDEELEKKKKEYEDREKSELEKARSILRPSVPDHMQLPQKPQELRPYDQAVRDEEQKKALAVEAQKKSSAQPLTVPKSKPKGRFGMPVKQKATTEGLKKDTRMG